MSEYQWKAVSVVGFDELMEALERADRKGYMPDAVKEAWEGFNWKPAQQEPVAAECKFDREQKWVRCEIAHHNLVQSEPHKWPEYQTRLLYTSSQAQRQARSADTWVGLTDEDIKEAEWLLSAIKEHEAYTLQEQLLVEGVDVFARAIEAKLKEKNGITKEQT